MLAKLCNRSVRCITYKLRHWDIKIKSHSKVFLISVHKTNTKPEMAQLLAKSTTTEGTSTPIVLPSAVRNMDKWLLPQQNSTKSGERSISIQNNEQLKAWVHDFSLGHNSNLDIDSEAGKSRLTHIVCTIGPASREVDMLVRLMKAGMNVCRLNFSHGTYEYHQQTVENIKQAVAQLPEGTVVATALDTKGPEIRTGLLEGGASAEVMLEKGGTIKITTDDAYKEKCSGTMLWVDYQRIVDTLNPDDLIYIDDGLISLTVLDKTSNALQCEIMNGGMLGSKKGVNLPNSKVDLPAVSEKDKQDLLFGVEQNVDMVFASFIQDAAGIREIRKVLGDKGAHVKIIAKIESFAGIRNFPEIINECDGAMVARGDMGIEIPPEKVFIAQKMMISACNRVSKPVICATQMLESMTYKPRATRAESNDVANAVLDGADCVMLSGESAKGSYPEEAVRHMSAVCLEAEAAYHNYHTFRELKSSIEPGADFSKTIALSAACASFNSMASAIIVLSSKVSTVHYISNFKPRCPIVMVTREPSWAKQCLLYRGVVPCVVSKPAKSEWDADMSMRVDEGINMGVRLGFIGTNDTLVLVMALNGETGSKTCSVQIISFDP